VRQSNGYVIGFIVAMTVLCAGALAGVNELLKDRIATQRSLDTKKKILSTVIPLETVLSKNDKQLESFYSENISGVVVNNNGEKLEGVDANEVNPRKQFKTKDVAQKQLPVFIYADESGEKTYILPMYGLGLWDEIWGFIAVGSDGNTVKGIVLDHKGETPGLGARITEPEVQARFVGKSFFDASKKIATLHFVKGEGNPGLDNTSIDGLSGATMTTNGVSGMLGAYYKLYEPYLTSLKQ